MKPVMYGLLDVAQCKNYNTPSYYRAAKFYLMSVCLYNKNILKSMDTNPLEYKSINLKYFYDNEPSYKILPSDLNYTFTGFSNKSKSIDSDVSREFCHVPWYYHEYAMMVYPITLLIAFLFVIAPIFWVGSMGLYTALGIALSVAGMWLIQPIRLYFLKRYIDKKKMEMINLYNANIDRQIKKLKLTNDQYENSITEVERTTIEEILLENLSSKTNE